MYTHIDIEPVVVSRNTRNANEMQNRSSDTDLQGRDRLGLAGGGASQ